MFILNPMFSFILLFLVLSLFLFSSPWVCHFSSVSLTLIFVLSPVSDSIHHLCCGLPVKVTGTGWKDEENKRAERWPHGVTERPGISLLSPPPPPLSSSLQLHMHTSLHPLFPHIPVIHSPSLSLSSSGALWCTWRERWQLSNTEPAMTHELGAERECGCLLSVTCKGIVYQKKVEDWLTCCSKLFTAYTVCCCSFCESL